MSFLAVTIFSLRTRNFIRFILGTLCQSWTIEKNVRFSTKGTLVYMVVCIIVFLAGITTLLMIRLWSKLWWNKQSIGQRWLIAIRRRIGNWWRPICRRRKKFSRSSCRVSNNSKSRNSKLSSKSRLSARTHYSIFAVFQIQQRIPKIFLGIYIFVKCVLKEVVKQSQQQLQIKELSSKN